MRPPRFAVVSCAPKTQRPLFFREGHVLYFFGSTEHPSAQNPSDTEGVVPGSSSDTASAPEESLGPDDTPQESPTNADSTPQTNGDQSTSVSAVATPVTIGPSQGSTVFGYIHCGGRGLSRSTGSDRHVHQHLSRCTK